MSWRSHGRWIHKLGRLGGQELPWKYNTGFLVWLVIKKALVVLPGQLLAAQVPIAWL